MKVNVLSILLLLISYSGFSQGNCSANAGIFQQLCVSDDLNLFGIEGDNFQQPLDVTWTASPNNPTTTTIVSPNTLQTPVIPDGGEFAPGTYQFEIAVVCSDGSISTDVVSIRFVEIVNPPVIENHPLIVCENSITLFGSLPDPGVTAEWSISPASIAITVEEIQTPSGPAYVITHDPRYDSGCSNTITYSFYVGGCLEETTTTVEFIESYTSLNAGVQGGCPSCELDIRLCGNGGCGGTPSWTIVGAPPGVAIGDLSLSSPNSTCTNFSAPEPGDYTFTYTVENGPCPTVTETVTCTIIESEIIDLGPTESYLICDDEWTIGSIDLAVEDFPGATYTWGVQFSNLPGVSIDFSDPNSASTTVNFNGAPVDVPNGARVSIQVRIWYTDCAGNLESDIKYFVYVINPGIDAVAEDLYFPCGGPSDYRPYENIAINGAGGTSLRITVLSAPPNSPYNNVNNAVLNNTTSFDLSEVGVYSFMVVQRLSGLNPNSNTLNTCRDTVTFTIYVSEASFINAGADGVVETCLEYFPLNGSIPMNGDQEILDIPVLWTQIVDPPATGPLTGISDPNIRNPVVGPLANGETYVFVYSYPNDDPDCEFSDTITIYVLPEEECPDCILTISVGECEDGCYEVNVTGAEGYMWSPPIGIDDVTSANPTICTSTGGSYTVFGYLDGEICDSITIQLDSCGVPPPPVTCEFTLEAECTTCSCGDEYGGGRVVDENGNTVDPSVVNINWFYNGQPAGSGVNPFYTIYDGPAVVSAEVSYTGDSISCTLFFSEAVTCLGDCPVISFVTCEDEAAANFEECKNYQGPNCGNGAFFGYVWALDQAGNIMDDFHLDWIGNGGSNNPNFVSGFNEDGSCIEFPVRVWSFTSGCDDTISFEPDCCGQLAPEVTCTEGREGGYDITWGQVCVAESYIASITCLDNNKTEFVEIGTPDKNGNYTVNVAPNNKCRSYSVTINSICSDGTYGPPSNCVVVNARKGCQVYEGPCTDIFGGLYKSGNEIAENLDRLEVYPNPVSTESLFVEVPENFWYQRTTLEISIIDINGQLIRKERIVEGNGIHAMELSELQNGLYMLSIGSLEGRVLESTRFVKESD